MKTFEEIRREVISDISVSEIMGAEKKCSFADVERQAAKEYAKQWVVISVALAGINRGVEQNEATVRLLEGKIDAQ